MTELPQNQDGNRVYSIIHGGYIPKPNQERDSPRRIRIDYFPDYSKPVQVDATDRRQR